MYQMTNTFLLFHAFLFYLCVEGNTENVFSKWFEKESKMISCGTIIPFPTTDSLSDCSMECFEHSWCTGILFDGSADIENRCKLVTSPFLEPIDLTGLLGHDNFIKKPGKKVNCNNMGIITPEGWRSECRKLYFPLDSDQSAIYGGSSANVNFSTDGKLMKILCPSNGKLHSG